jgi:3-deoxy-D-manno-octulosonic-acid transferase
MIVVDRVGVLAELYTVADVAWVGGGFHAAGLHSVLEPAAAGVPVVFGPRHHSSRAAGELLGLGAARAVANVGDARAVLHAWLADASAGATAGGAGHGYIEAHRGAAGRTADLLAGLIAGAGVG